ncbi:unnamed protein product [Chondrus crispus]|uniref:Sacsin/Nov domain-containing protein n=1 Tax=Chondrus crispus TaxID=2769 RepID=R7QBU6_CHOCR|nr:unnamed protein product [Chondrus crispus]CDF34901.1 unnamed protein product [Chondrus crispus]|eukprot:XP_005714720.1 unnamed protein product [Chondrus crispus]
MSSSAGDHVAAANSKVTSAFESIRSAVLATGVDTRVEVNQRALIDKILARYASAGAVYRELLQNSNDAEATTAEIHFTTCPVPSGALVTEVVYKNDGLPFRNQDWARMRKIAEGNPDVSKVGAFGVGAYTMFSICEEPMVVSGGQAMAFAWKGDALWVKIGKAPGPVDQWTSFVLRSRDPYPVPDLVEFGQFLCSSLTFTSCLNVILVFVDGKRRLTISKRQLDKPRIIKPPKASNWWKGDGAVTTSPKHVFTLGRSDGSITETLVEIIVNFDGDSSVKRARYVSALADTKVPSDMARRMQRVTKKLAPSQVKIEVFVDANDSSDNGQKKSRATKITSAFSPGMGAGRVFIGFKTSQTTGLAAHLAAPLLPTVEREAIDFQDPTLRIYNCELLAIAGIVLRLTLEHSMSYIGEQYAKTEPERLAYEARETEKTSEKEPDSRTGIESAGEGESAGGKVLEESSNPLFSFAKFMSSGVKKIANAITSSDLLSNGGHDVFHPPDSRPLSKEEKDAISLMRSFSPQPSTPDALVGTVLANGFQNCLPGVSPLVLTKSGMVRGLDARLPYYGIEGFVKKGVVRNIVLKNAENYLLHVAGCRSLNMDDLVKYCSSNPLHTQGIVRLLTWWTRYSRADTSAATYSLVLKQSISFMRGHADSIAAGTETTERVDATISFRDIEFYLDKTMLSSDLPMPPFVLPKELLDVVPDRILTDKYLVSWFSPLPFQYWAHYVATHPCLTDGRSEDNDIRMKVLVVMSREHSKLSGNLQKEYERVLHRALSRIRCVPVDGQPASSCQTDVPADLYLRSAELGMFRGLGTFQTVSAALGPANVSEDFLICIGVRKTVSIDFLFSQLDRLKWNRNPKPLITFLRSTNLSTSDLEKLRSTQYLPAVNDKSRTFAPPELYLPNEAVGKFPFVKTLQWSSETLREDSPDGEFLVKLGCKVEVPLSELMKHLSVKVLDESDRRHGIDYLCKKLVAGGSYTADYKNYLERKFLPATVEYPLRANKRTIELHSPNSCFSSAECSCLGFPILDSHFTKGKRLGYDRVLRCATKPTSRELGTHFISVVGDAMRMAKETSQTDEILKAFERVFEYLSTRATELDREMIEHLSKTPFIPQETGDGMTWFLPREIYFSGDGGDGEDFTNSLFPVRRFSPFLATMGVKSQPSTEDLFRMVLSSPNRVLAKLGSSKYLALLRRIAANPPYREVTPQMKKSPFLLSIQLTKTLETRLDIQSGDSETQDRNKFVLAKACDICIIDNSRYSRMFTLLAAPQESDIEIFYKSLGSPRISQKVRQNFWANGGQNPSTELTKSFWGRISERRPLLVSNVVSQPLSKDAVVLLSDDVLQIYEVSRINAKYCYGSQESIEKTTCTGYVGEDVTGAPSSTKQGGERKFYIFVTQGLDWFHVGNVIGSQILQKCDVQDAFFIGSLLEAPLDQLRARGFPVDRILHAEDPAEDQPVKVEESSTNPSLNPEPEASPERKPIKSRENLLSANKQQEQPHSQPKLNPSQSFTSGDSQVPGLKKQKGDLLSRAVKGLRGLPRSTRTRFSEKTPPGSVGPSQGGGKRKEGSRPSTAGHVDDAANHEGVQEMLRQSVGSTRHISTKQKKVHFPADESGGTIPEAMGQAGLTCDAAIVEDLELFTGPSDASRTPATMTVFSTLGSEVSKTFLATNWSAVKSFMVVLSRLCEVYSLRLDTVAIYHAPLGPTVAFNSAKRLFFNIRYFVNLHYRTKKSYRLECYAFWWSVMAHELSHNLISEHNREHGFFTERYTQTYLGPLISTLKRKGDVAGL